MPGDPMSAGFVGKIPARGDFVRAGLSRPLVDAWDRWLERVLPATERRLGDRWAAVWQAAPVWRFVLPAGHCGPAQVAGLWLPSADRVGRRFPLMIAAENADPDAGFFDRAEQAGREAIAWDLAPETLLARLQAIAPAHRSPDPGGARTTGLWWSGGGPEAEGGALGLDGLPDAAVFAGMLVR